MSEGGQKNWADRTGKGDSPVIDEQTFARVLESADTVILHAVPDLIDAILDREVKNGPSKRYGEEILGESALNDGGYTTVLTLPTDQLVGRHFSSVAKYLHKIADFGQEVLEGFLGKKLADLKEGDSFEAMMEGYETKVPGAFSRIYNTMGEIRRDIPPPSQGVQKR